MAYRIRRPRGNPDELLERVRATPRSQIRKDLSHVEERHAVPPWARRLTDDSALLRRLCDSVEHVYAVLLAPHWAHVTDEAVRWFGRLREFEETVAAAQRPEGLPTPPCLGWDEEALVVASEWLRGARSGHDLAAAGEFDEGLARTAGRMIGTLHSLVPEQEPGPAPGAEPDLPRLPPLDLFDCLPLDYFTEAGGACLEG
ncbi:hypothetical protein ACHZ98_23315 [Streptomyces sp. MAR4 CNY-716]